MERRCPHRRRRRAIHIVEVGWVGALGAAGASGEVHASALRLRQPMERRCPHRRRRRAIHIVEVGWVGEVGAVGASGEVHASALRLRKPMARFWGWRGSLPSGGLGRAFSIFPSCPSHSCFGLASLQLLALKPLAKACYHDAHQCVYPTHLQGRESRAIFAVHKGKNDSPGHPSEQRALPQENPDGEKSIPY
jgi:hypothetical protein